MTIAPNLSDFSKQEIIDTLNEVRHPFDVVVIGSGNYFNIAGIIRTAHSFLVQSIYLVDVEDEKEPFYEKGTMGNHKYENIRKMTLEGFLMEVSNNNRNVVSFERRPGILSTATSWDYKYPEKPMLVFGSEKYGVPDEVIAISKDVVSIPMFGLNNDLNIGYCASIAMYDWITKFYCGDRSTK